MTVNTTTIRIWSMILIPKNILRCSASLRMDGIAKRLITTDMTTEIKGAIQRYFLFQKKKNTTDTMGMIQNTEIFHQFISIPLSSSFLLILSYLKNTYKAIFSWSCLILLRNKKALGILYLKKNPMLCKSLYSVSCNSSRSLSTNCRSFAVSSAVSNKSGRFFTVRIRDCSLRHLAILA